MPKLIYIKDSDARDSRLNDLIDRIRSDDTASYITFTDADELSDRVASDLATLLAERFEQSRSGVSEDVGGAASVVPRVPLGLTSTVGRDEDIARVRGLLETGRAPRCDSGRTRRHRQEPSGDRGCPCH